jgi:hypothetical protein
VFRRFFLRLPPIARRDERVKDLQRKNHRLRKILREGPPPARIPQAPKPSYRAMMYQERRLNQLGRGETSVIALGKFRVQDLAQSHGIDIPRRFGRWDRPEDIAWDELPDRVVIKSRRGSSSRGVLPLRRADGGWQIISHSEVLSDGQVSALLATKAEEGRIAGPFSAEEFIDEDGTGTSTPLDVKIYTFYGEAPMVLIRRVVKHGDPDATFRIIDRHGRDVGDIYSGKPIDQTMEPPPRLAETVETAERLSVAIRAQFSRLDFYNVDDRIVFGEVTPRPGGPQWFGPDLDAVLGEAWERAMVRYARDIADGMSPEFQWGPVLDQSRAEPRT